VRHASIRFSAILSAAMLAGAAVSSLAQDPSMGVGPFNPRSGRYAVAHSDAPRPADTLAVSSDRVWAALAGVYSDLGIPLSVVDTEVHVLGALRVQTRRPVAGERMSQTLECGSGAFGPNADRYTVALTVLSNVAPLPDGRTLLDTRVSGTAAPNGLNSSVSCTSNGFLEDKITSELRKKTTR
jgi:hypothetical protein